MRIPLSLATRQYHFRIRHESNLPAYYQNYNAIVPPALQVDQNSLFGYVHFRQIRDKTVKRGYFQKSLVLLSKLPFISLFLSMVSQLGPNYFQYGLESLETCCHLMDRQWPEPEPGKTLLLPLLGNVLQVRIPTHGDKPFSSSDLVQFRSIVTETMTTSTNSMKYPIDDETEIESSTLTNHSSNKQPVISRFADRRWQRCSTLLDFYSEQYVHVIRFSAETWATIATFDSVRPRCGTPINRSRVFWHIFNFLWELILLNESIAILGSFPTHCSQTVQALGKCFVQTLVLWEAKESSLDV